MATRRTGETRGLGAAGAATTFPMVFSSDLKAFVAVDSGRRMASFRRAREHGGTTMVLTGEWSFDGTRHYARYVDAAGESLWFTASDAAVARVPPAQGAGHVEVRFTDGSRR